ncbi:MAG: methyltransferase domain-containing protein [Woeseiaceae bacterium]|nr:methyltransferase domain-containing protein [Woeseiaceae bacterium]
MAGQRTTPHDNELHRYFAGEALYGDDFRADEIRQWFEDEREGYANLGAKNRDDYRYAYHQLNTMHAYQHLGDMRFDSALGIGSAYGDEFQPIAGRIENLTILEASEALSKGRVVHGIPCRYVAPDESGDLPFESGSFDLITSFGVLHHIPNVTHVINECGRVLADSGVMLLREPIVSMGDWRNPRHGLTRHERGIPLHLLREMVGKAGFRVERATLCVFPPLTIICRYLGISPYLSRVAVATDAMLCRLFRWNLRYHATAKWHKVRPTAVFYVLVKSQTFER